MQRTGRQRNKKKKGERGGRKKDKKRERTERYTHKENRRRVRKIDSELQQYIKTLLHTLYNIQI